MGASQPYFRIVAERFAGHGRKFAKKASTAFTIGGIVAFEIGAGTIRPWQSGDIPLGICQQAVASTDTNYAATTPIEVEILFRGAECYVPVSTGTVALTELGDEMDVVAGGLSCTLTESANHFRQVALNGSSTNSVTATCISTVY